MDVLLLLSVVRLQVEAQTHPSLMRLIRLPSQFQGVESQILMVSVVAQYSHIHSLIVVSHFYVLCCLGSRNMRCRV